MAYFKVVPKRRSQKYVPSPRLFLRTVSGYRVINFRIGTWPGEPKFIQGMVLIEDQKISAQGVEGYPTLTMQWDLVSGKVMTQGVDSKFNLVLPAKGTLEDVVTKSIYK